MKNERAHTDALMATLRTSLPHSRILKHSDRFTSGIPDMTVSWNHATTWLEIKRLLANELIFDQIDMDQVIECAKLQRACDRAWVIAYQSPKAFTHHEHTFIYSPRFLLANKDSRDATILHPSRVDDGVDVRKLWEQGVLHLHGYNHESIVTLISQTHL